MVSARVRAKEIAALIRGDVFDEEASDHIETNSP
jgi:hypothetical protein